NTIWNFAEQAVPQRSAGAFNQALMDLGAMICTPAEPRCPECPVRTCCRAFQQGVQHSVPRPRARPQVTYVDEAMIAVRDDGRYLLRQGLPGERWAGLWEFVRIRLESAPAQNGNGRREKTPANLRALSTKMARRLEGKIAERTGLVVEAQ